MNVLLFAIFSFSSNFMKCLLMLDISSHASRTYEYLTKLRIKYTTHSSTVRIKCLLFRSKYLILSMNSVTKPIQSYWNYYCPIHHWVAYIISDFSMGKNWRPYTKVLEIKSRWFYIFSVDSTTHRTLARVTAATDHRIVVELCSLETYTSIVLIGCIGLWR